MKVRQLTGRIARQKWLVIVLGTLFLIVFSRGMTHVNLTDTAIVVGVGIDFADNKFHVSTQAVIFEGNNADGSSAPTYTVYSAEGDTVSEALNAISHKMGLIVTLSHCNMIVLSESVLGMNFTNLFAPLLKTYSLPDQAVITASADKPEKVLSAKTGTTTSSPFYIQELLLQTLGTDGLTRRSLKNLLADTMSESGATTICYIEMKKMEEQPQGGQQEVKDAQEFDLYRNVVIRDKDHFIIEKEMALVTTLFRSSDIKGRLSVTLPDGEVVEFRVIKKKQSDKVNGLSINTEIELFLSFIEVQNYDTDIRIKCTDPIVIAAAKQLESIIEDYLTQSFELSKSSDADFMLLTNMVYRKMGRKMPSDTLKQIDFQVNVKTTVNENG